MAISADMHHKAEPNAPGLPHGHVPAWPAAMLFVNETPSHPTYRHQISSGVDETRLNSMDDLPLA